jgi:predicted dehydrogenase
MRRAGRAAWVRLAPPARCRADAMTHFIDAICDARPLESDFQDAVRVYEILEAADRSAATSDWVEIADPPPATPIAAGPWEPPAEREGTVKHG